MHRRDKLRSERILQDRLFANPKVNVVWHAEVDEILGDADPARVTGVRLRDVRTGALSELATDGVFVAIGHAPATALVDGQVRLKPNGYVWTAPDSTATSVTGLFAAGDVADGRIPPGGDGGWARLHGRARGRTFPGRARSAGRG